MKTFAIRCLPLCFVFLQGCTVFVCNTSDDPVLFKGEDGSQATVQPCECEQLTEIIPFLSGYFEEFGAAFSVNVCNENGRLDSNIVNPFEINDDGETYFDWNGSSLGYSTADPPNLNNCE